jgi:hypothetical protein
MPQTGRPKNGGRGMTIGTGLGNARFANRTD